MSSSTRPAAARIRSLRPVLAAACFFALAACDKGDSSPSTGGGPGATPPAGDPAKVSLTVAPPDPSGRRYASVKIEPSAAIGEAQLSFEIPPECRVVAGAAVRPVKNLIAGNNVSQELAFECTGEPSTGVTATFKVPSATGGAPFEKKMEAKP